MMGFNLLGAITLAWVSTIQVCGTSPQKHLLSTSIQEHHLGTSPTEIDQSKQKEFSDGSKLLKNYTIKTKEFINNTKKHLEFHRLFKRDLGYIARPSQLTEGESLPSGQELATIPCPTDKCTCTRDLQTKEYNLNCRLKKLYLIPEFTLVTTQFYQASFTKNFIHELPSNAFRNLKVERIDLQENSIRVIQPGAFSGLDPYLRELYLDGDFSGPMPFDKIENLYRLRRIQLRNFMQTEINSNNHFDRFPDLEELLMLNIKGLKNFNSMAFTGKLQMLQRLRVENASLDTIPVESLQDLPRLRTLEIRDCKISNIFSRTFSDLQSITHIDLSRNSITHIVMDAFSGVSNQIEYLDLSFNEIRPDSLLSVSSQNWESLQFLKLEYNKIEFFRDGTFSNMPNLQYLFLTEVHMTEVTYDLFKGLPNLHTLDISYNKIARVENGALRDLKNLFELRLNHQFFVYGGETPLSLSLELQDGAFSGLSDSLSIFNLQWTPIKSEQLWKNLKDLTNLSELNLERVRLQNIPEYAFSNNKKLQKIFLNSNQLTNVPQTAFVGLQNSLDLISFDNNSISTISECTFKNFTKLNFMTLQNNNLNCDCRLRWLHEFVSEENRFYYQNWKCAVPAKYNGLDFFSISASDLTCNGVTPELCKTITTLGPSVTTDKPTEKTTLPSNKEITLTVAGAKEKSLTLVIINADFEGLSGFRLEYFATANDNTKQVKDIHKNAVVQTIHDLQPGTFYTVCVIPEINYQHETSKKACRTTQTLGIHNGREEQTDENSDNSQNIVIGVTLAAFAVVILIIIGVYSIVKYKVQKLKTIQMSLGMAPPHMRLANGERFCLEDEDGKIYTTGNIYTDVGNARIANQYQMGSPRHMQRQFAVEDKLADSQSLTYAKVNKKRQRAVDESEKDQAVVRPHDHAEDSNDTDRYEGAIRHSAPSRLNVLDLPKTSTDKTSRPLPATPEELKGGLKFKGKTKTGSSSKKIVTQASVYEHNLNKSTDPIYHEIESDENT